CARPATTPRRCRRAPTPGTRCRCWCTRACAAPTAHLASTSRARAPAASAPFRAAISWRCCSRTPAGSTSSEPDVARRAGGVAAGAALAAALAWLGAPARAVTIDPALFLFPGSPSNATSAASAGVAFADRWLGDRPFDNPALETRRMVELTPLLEHISRQDLSAANRNFIETGAFVDVGG